LNLFPKSKKKKKLKIGVVENIELNKKPLKEALPASGKFFCC